MAEILKLTSSIAGEITTIIALLAIILPKSRNAIVKWLKKALEIDRGIYQPRVGSRFKESG